jgi:2-desacetyl-2-hydroxyethyl bacteriochlorophyllide A dehydrogenase
MRTHAIVFRKANTPSLEELDLPDLEQDELLVRIHYSGVSIGTESSIFSGTRTHNGTFPLVGGYMAAGIVEQVGPAVQRAAVGDHVTAGGARLTGEVASVWGGHSSRQVVRESGVRRIPDGVEMAHAAMYVLSGVGLNAVTMARVSMTDTVLIQGQGLIGQLCGQWCRNRGARVITLEPDTHRAELSRKYVTDLVLDPADSDLETHIKELTAGQGASVVVEATGAAKLIDNATRFLSPNGKLIFLSWYPGRIELDYGAFHKNQTTAFFPMGAGGETAAQATLRALAGGAIRMADNITDVVPWTEACRGYERIIGGDRSIMGMVIDWRGCDE